ncbi:MAG: DUF455 family protein [Bdellovibrionaceae bacterium]|nr:DUF455 family protein [Pseudobdellovibrionaceae bacterium]MBX3034283.1 DUF455 family protein [Pseudobdellovibrionaceae bacterium]
MSVLSTACVRQKLREVEGACHEALLGRAPPAIPALVARDIEVREAKLHPPKEGLSTPLGRARLLHDMASIELQAMELALRGLQEYPDAPREFREELAALTLSEAGHLKLCLDTLEDLGHRWGDWPVHLSLWQAVSAEDSLLDRVLIVHRYLEASGLDAGDRLLRRLEGLGRPDGTQDVIELIHREEIGHVDFGSRWYRELCRAQRIDPDHDFPVRMGGLRQRLPYRTENLAVEIRLKAGFTMKEILEMEDWRLRSRREASSPSAFSRPAFPPNS